MFWFWQIKGVGLKHFTFAKYWLQNGSYIFLCFVFLNVLKREEDNLKNKSQIQA